MPFDHQHRTALLRHRANAYARVALACVTREYPVMPYFVATGPGPYPTHRALHPAFYGAYDWHSCVEMHWAAVRLLRRFPDHVPAAQIRTTLDDLLTPENLATETRFFADPNHRTLERPYGWAWYLTLTHELATWDDPDAHRWAATLAPLADLLATNLVAWLPTLTYAQRTGLHPNTAFALSRSFDFASLRADHGDPALLDAIHEAAPRWFLPDTDYPAHYEPSGADFLSPALCEAELMSRILPPSDFPAWLDRFLPGIPAAQPETLFHPATVSDPTDGQIAHLHGLNLSRAWACIALADRHAAASLPHVVGSHYMVEHWLAAYATLLLT